MKKYKNYFPLLILAALLVIISLAIYKSSQNNAEEQIESEFNTPVIKQKIKLPEFSLPDAFDDNKIFTLQNLINKEKKYSLLNFFASWCSTCRAEHEILLQLKDENLIDIYGIAWHDFKNNTVDFLNKNGNPFKQVALDSQGLFTKIVGIKAVPETMLVDANGVVILRYQGNISYEHIEEIRKIISEK